MSRPPPTPSPPPPPPPIATTPIVQVNDGKRLPLPLHPSPSFNVSSELRGLVPDPRSAAASNGGRFVVQQPHPPFPAQPSPVGLMAAVTGPPGSNATAGEPIGTSVLPSRVQANLNSIEEAGVGPMAPLIEDDNSRLSTNSSTDDPVSYFLLFFFFHFVGWHQCE